jgi:hypothetical protein
LGEEKKQGFGYDDDKAQQTDQEKKQGAKKVFGTGEISFSRPKFSNKKTSKFGNKGDFDAGLDDLDDEGN